MNGTDDRQRMFCEGIISGFPAGRACGRAGYVAPGMWRRVAGRTRWRQQMSTNVNVASCLAKLWMAWLLGKLAKNYEFEA